MYTFTSYSSHYQVLGMSNGEEHEWVNTDLEVPHQLVAQVRLASSRQSDLEQYINFCTDFSDCEAYHCKDDLGLGIVRSRDLDS